MNQQIDLSAVPAQKLSVTLNNQDCQISVYQLFTGLFVDLVANGTPIFTCRLANDKVNLARNQAYNGFSGQLFFVDQQGTDDPVYTGLGTRFVLLYAPPV